MLQVSFVLKGTAINNHTFNVVIRGDSHVEFKGDMWIESAEHPVAKDSATCFSHLGT